MADRELVFGDFIVDVADGGGEPSDGKEIAFGDFIVDVAAGTHGRDGGTEGGGGEPAPLDWSAAVVGVVAPEAAEAPVFDWGAVVVAARSRPRPGKAKPRKKKPGAPKATATVGGVDYSLGGWAAYEAERRHAERDVRGLVLGGCGPCGAGAFYAGGAGARFYAGRTTIGGRDAAESLLAARPPGALKKAAAHLSKALGNLEDALCDQGDDGAWECDSPATLLAPLAPLALLGPEGARGPLAFTIPPLTSEDVDAFVEDGDYTSPDDLYMIANDAIATAATLQETIAPPPALKNRSVPALPARMVSLADDAAVVKLERAAVRYASRVEELQSAVAGILDKTAAVIDAALARHRGA